MLCTHAEIPFTDGEVLGHCSEGEKERTEVEVAASGMFVKFLHSKDRALNDF